MSDNTKLALLSAALDLKRITTGYEAGSTRMAERFHQECLRWLNDVDTKELKPYLANIIESLAIKLETDDKAAQAEIALTYSLIIQNYVSAV